MNIKSPFFSPEALQAWLLSAQANTGDIFTDADECEQAVTGAKNLSVLANLLAPNTPQTDALLKGTLLVGGEPACEATVAADGSVTSAIAAEDLEGGGDEKLQLSDGSQFDLTFYPDAEFSECGTWLVTNPTVFYKHVLGLA